MDIRDLWRPESNLTARRALVLVEQLPDDSAFMASVAHTPRGWTLERYITVARINADLPKDKGIPLPNEPTRAQKAWARIQAQAGPPT